MIAKRSADAARAGAAGGSTGSDATPAQGQQKPRGATGLDDPGWNMSALNTLLQVLYSAQPFRAAALHPPAAAPTEGVVSGTVCPCPTEAVAQRVAASLGKLFAQMGEPDRASASALAVAGDLYSVELGEHQDSDELLRRLFSLFTKGLRATSCKPDTEAALAIRSAFCRMYVGTTRTVRFRGGAETCNASAGGAAVSAAEVQPQDGTEDASFVTLPVQRGHLSLTGALDEFTAWSSDETVANSWTRTQFRKLPPFLCFTSKQASALEWEETLNLTRFAVKETQKMQRQARERSEICLTQAELRDTLRHLASSSDCLGSAESLSTEQMRGELKSLSEALGSFSAGLRHRLEAVDARLRALEDDFGDGIEDPGLADFLADIVDAATLQDVIIVKLLGGCSAHSPTVKRLAEVVLGAAAVDRDGTAGGSQALNELVSQGSLSREAADAILSKVRARREVLCTHVYDVHSIIVYEGAGRDGHYLTFVRQPDGAFLCFNDQRVSEYDTASAVRATITQNAQRNPTCVRLLVYRRRGGTDEPYEVPQAEGSEGRATYEVGAGEGGDKRRRLH